MRTITFTATDNLEVTLRPSTVTDWSINEPATNTDEDPVLEVVMSRDHAGRPAQRILVAGVDAYRVAHELLLSSAARHGITPYPSAGGYFFDGPDRAIK